MSTLTMSPSSMTGRIGDAVADDLVDAGAHGFRESAVAERRRICPVVAHVFVGDGIDVVGGDAGFDHLADGGKSVRRDPSGGADGLDLIGRVEVAAAAFIGF
jgi:hypothetical protein